jgi:hypothetical protein
MAVLGTYRQSPDERKRYSIDYSEWLATSETLTNVDLTPNDAALIIDGNTLTNSSTAVTFFVSGGVDGAEYLVEALATTSDGQLKEDTIKFKLKDLS